MFIYYSIYIYIYIYIQVAFGGGTSGKPGRGNLSWNESGQFVSCALSLSLSPYLFHMYVCPLLLHSRWLMMCCLPLLFKCH